VSTTNTVDLDEFTISIPTNHTRGKVVVSIRPEDISISSQPIPGGVEFIAYSVLPAGADTTIVARRGNIELNVREMGISRVGMDQKIWLKFDVTTLNLYDKESGTLIRP